MSMRRRGASLVMAALAAASVLLTVAVAGCGSKKDEVPSNYYTGPMAKKGAPAAATQDEQPGKK